MTVILKDIPGMTGVEILDALHDIRPGQPTPTGHGGFVTDEETALEFLQAYLVAFGRLPAPVVDSDPIAQPKRRANKKGSKP